MESQQAEAAELADQMAAESGTLLGSGPKLPAVDVGDKEIGLPEWLECLVGEEGRKPMPSNLAAEAATQKRLIP